MKRIRLTESEMDVKMESSLKSFNSLSEAEKMKWKDAVKQCIQELGYGNMVKTDSTAFLYLAALAAGGLILGIGFLVGMAVVPAVFIGIIDKDKIIKIIKCARNKRKGGVSTDTNADTTTPEQSIQETKMKKTIRLTESELVQLVQRIIKEDEMMGMDSSMPTKGITLNQLGIKEPAYMAYLKGTTPFYVNGKEQKQNIIIKPTDVLFSKDCMIEFVGNKSKRNFTLVFDNNGKASLRK
jgi:hypothetical protein